MVPGDPIPFEAFIRAYGKTIERRWKFTGSRPFENWHAWVGRLPSGGRYCTGSHSRAGAFAYDDEAAALAGCRLLMDEVTATQSHGFWEEVGPPPGAAGPSKPE